MSTNLLYYLTQADASNETSAWIYGFKESPTTLDFSKLFKNDNVNSIYIEKDAFKDCTTLTTITFDERLKQIESEAFSNCTNLQTVEFAESPSTLPKLHRGCFKGCNNIETITNMVFDSNTSSFLGAIFGAQTFHDRLVPNTLHKVTVKSRLLPYCFANCEHIKEIIWADSCVQIPVGAFYNCKRLVKAYAKKSKLNEKIISLAFGNLLDLTSITYVGDAAFKGCFTLDTVYLDTRLVGLGIDSFQDCLSLVRVYNNSSLPITANSDTYGRVGYYALEISSTSTNKSIEPLGTVLTTKDKKCYLIHIPSSAIEAIDGIRTLYLSAIKKFDADLLSAKITHIRPGLTTDYVINKIIFNAELVSIGDNAFSDLPDLEACSFGSNIKHIGRGAFNRCINLNKLDVVEIESWSKVDFGYPQHIYDYVTKFSYVDEEAKIVVVSNTENADTHTFTIYPGDKVNLLTNANFFSELVISGTPEEIPANTFYNCHAMEELHIPASVQVIGANAFAGCTSLQYTVEETNLPSSAFGGVKRIDNWIFGPEKDDSDWSDTFKGYTYCCIDTIGTSELHFYTDAFKSCSTLKAVILRGASKYDCLSTWFNSTFNNILSNPLYKEDFKDDPRALYCVTNFTNTLNIENKITDIDFSERIAGGNALNNITYLSDFAFSGLVLDSVRFINIPKTDIATNLCKQISAHALDFCYIEKVSCLPSMVKYFNNSELVEIEVVPFTYIVLKNTLITNLYQDTKIASNALKDCVNLNKVTFAEPLYSGNAQFTSTPSVYLGLSHIGSDAFYNCPNISAIYFFGNKFSNVNSTETTWSQIQFENQYSNPMSSVNQEGEYPILYINNTKIPAENAEAIEFFDDYIRPFVFLNLKNIKTINFKTIPQVIDAKGFIGCSNLRTLTLDAQVESTDNLKYSFIKSTATDNAGSYIVRTHDSALIYGTGGNQIINGSVKRIVQNAFCQNTDLVSLTIPNTVEVIETSALAGCTKLTTLNIPFLGRSTEFDNNTGHFTYIFGAVQSNDSVALPTELTLTLTGNNININSKAFEGCKDVFSKLYITGTITRATGSPFSPLAKEIFDIISNANYKFDCITNGLQSQKPVVLVSCSDVDVNSPSKEISIQDIQYIYSGAFNNKNIVKLTNTNSLTIIGDSAFAGCENLTTFDLSTISHVGDYAFSNTGLSSAQFSRLKTAGMYIFNNCDNLRTLRIPATLSIDNTKANAFAGIPDLHQVEMPADISAAFGSAKNNDNSKSKLRSVIINSGTKINNSAFASCPWLRSVQIRETANIKEIGSYAFKDCISLNQFSWGTIYNTCEVIGTQAFYNCWNLYTVKIPKNTKLLNSPKTYTLFIRHPIKTQNEIFCANQTTISTPTDLAYRFTVSKACTLRFLSNNFFVRIYEITNKNKLNAINYSDIVNLQPNTNYCLDFLPYNSFTKTDVGIRESNIDTVDVTRPIDLYIQIKDSNEKWQDLTSAEIKDIFGAQGTDFITIAGTSYSVKKDLLFIATPKETNGQANLNSSGFKYNDIYDATSTDPAKKSPYIIINGSINIEAYKYVLASSIKEQAFENCYKLYKIEDPTAVLNSMEDSLLQKTGLLNNEKLGIVLEADSTDSNFIFYRHPVSSDVKYSNKYELIAYLNPFDISETVKIPEYINIISAYTFINRDDFRAEFLELPIHLEIIGKKAFYDCDKLDHTKLNILPSIVIEEDAFGSEN